MNKTYMSVAALLMFSLVGCISDPKYVEEDFGKSVTQMVNAQIYDPEAASYPDEIPPLIIDGSAAGSSVDGYRKDAKRNEEASGNITFTVN